MADTYKHGVYIEEVPTSLLPTITAATPTVAIGVAPKGEVNVPKLCHSLKEFVEEFGWDEDFTTYTLCEAAHVHFQLYNVAPVVFINVFESTRQVSRPLSMSSLSAIMAVPEEATDFKVFAAGVELSESDFSFRGGNLSLTAEGISAAQAAGLSMGATSGLSLSWEEPLDPATLTAAAIVGGYDDTTGKNTGLECIEEVYPRFGLIPGQIICPGWSATSTEVVAAMKAKCSNINGIFKAIAIADINTAQAKTYTKVNSVKNKGNYADPFLITTYPKVGLGGAVMNLSSHVAALLCKVDAANDDIPYKSPSNESLQCDRAALADGTEIFLGKSQANYLNGIGVVTALNFVGGWKCWGNELGAFPGTSDPKDKFISVRRMMNWIGNTLATTYWSRISMPINRRLLESVIDSAQIWLNGLTARGALVSGRIEMREDENPVTDLTDGIIRFHLLITPPAPARELTFILEYDVEAYSKLFT